MDQLTISILTHQLVEEFGHLVLGRHDERLCQTGERTTGCGINSTSTRKSQKVTDQVEKAECAALSIGTHARIRSLT